MVLASSKVGLEMMNAFTKLNLALKSETSLFRLRSRGFKKKKHIVVRKKSDGIDRSRGIRRWHLGR